MLLYLDQNYISCFAKFTLGQEDHNDFGALLQTIRQTPNLIIPPSSFHALESAESYLLPTIQELFQELSKGYWIKPWKEVLAQQLDGEIEPHSLLSQQGSWENHAQIDIFHPLFQIKLEGHLNKRIKQMQHEVRSLLNLTQTTTLPPFADILARMIAFRTRNEARQLMPSDCPDIVMAATIRPYQTILATDRFVREALHRLGFGENVYSGRSRDVKELQRVLEGLTV